MMAESRRHPLQFILAARLLALLPRWQLEPLTSARDDFHGAALSWCCTPECVASMVYGRPS